MMKNGNEITNLFVCDTSVGQRCDTVFDGCKSKPCRNGGTCAVASNTPHGFICKCPPVSTRSQKYTQTSVTHKKVVIKEQKFFLRLSKF